MNKLSENQMYILFRKAENGDKRILSDPMVSQIEDRFTNTPLHILARLGVKEVLDHPDASKVKNFHDQTPKDIINGILAKRKSNE